MVYITMLSRKENFIETISGGKPDRFVNQWEYIAMIAFSTPVDALSPFPEPGGEAKNAWGVTIRMAENTPGPFPVHDEEHIVLKDITKWRDVVHAPALDFPDSAWDAAKSQAAAVNRDEQLVTPMIFPGLFEALHYLMGMDGCLINFYEEPEQMHALLDYITDYELKLAELYCGCLKPDALLHHDDWGSYKQSFFSPAMFEEFFVPRYKKIYGYYKDHGCKYIIHHSDSYAANLVPGMIEMGIDVWQGCTSTNNVPSLVKKYGGQISFMGDLDNGVLDKEGWSREEIAEHVRRACTSNGKHYFIPCLAAGGPVTTYAGVFEAVSEEIDRLSKEMF
jgi:uroporphyrinogen-III decarboxylase